ncbi:hypothetical protein EJB05_48924 [Eragrostis curvula]|uniref:CAAX prenyl protease 2/Lysostaphin resistance protein A-like domain-containing protein n=1 Tax=Eragrostis curvula TaxID=38414 RepID=A0A5J9T301_9POAL|nr:hypothetical protein EJB05_48924 [Eragrostis curvula]
MASPPSLLLGPRPPPCCRSRRRSVGLHRYKRSAHPCPFPRTGRRQLAAAVAEQLLPRPPGTSRRTVATGSFACRCSYDAENGPPSPPPDKEKSLEDEWAVLRRWDVPWEWPTISLTMVACAVSFLLTGMVEKSLLEQVGFQSVDATLDEKAEVLFLGQFMILTSPFSFCASAVARQWLCLELYLASPVPFDHSQTIYFVMSLGYLCNGIHEISDFRDPFNLQNGWLLWAGIGIFVAVVAIAIAGVAMTFLNGETPQRETDSLVLILPLIGSSSISTICLLGITGVLAPILEETVFRGFLMVSLSMWFSTPYSVLITAAMFAFAHLTPGEFPQLFLLGVVLGFSYAQTRNLLTPITIHAVWNSGVILLLTFLQLQGYDIKELLKAS